MKIIVGKNPNNDFKVIGESGADITAELEVKSLTITADADSQTMITLEVYGAAEVAAENVTIRIKGKRP